MYCIYVVLIYVVKYRRVNPCYYEYLLLLIYSLFTGSKVSNVSLTLTKYIIYSYRDYGKVNTVNTRNIDPLYIM